MVIVRYPPSPTGLLHVGTVRTMLYNYLFAKQNGGKIVMRLEDTDAQRSTKEFEEDILNGIQKLGLNWDDDVIHQSERTDIYSEHLKKLLNEDKAYYCFCTKEELAEERGKREAQKLPPRYSEKCSHLPPSEQNERIQRGESVVIRFRTPKEQEVVFQDLVRGEVKFHTKDLDDFVIARSANDPLYNFTVVIDDHLMNISHVIRGEDHISNTPKQILIYQAFGWDAPAFAHIPLILNQDKSKLSKRKNKVAVDDYLEDGILPEALLNFLALLGWNTSDENEIFSITDLIREFSLDRVHKGGAIFDLEKLMWLSGMWIRQKSLEEFTCLAEPFLQENIFTEGRKEYGEKFYEKALSLVQERCKKLSELPDFLRFFFIERLEYSAELFHHKKMKVDRDIAFQALNEGVALLEKISESDWREGHLKELLLKKAEELGWKNGQLLWPLRVALSGEEFSPGTFELLEIFGKERSLQRIERGIKLLQ